MSVAADEDAFSFMDDYEQEEEDENSTADAHSTETEGNAPLLLVQLEAQLGAAREEAAARAAENAELRRLLAAHRAAAHIARAAAAGRPPSLRASRSMLQVLPPPSPSLEHRARLRSADSSRLLLGAGRSCASLLSADASDVEAAYATRLGRAPPKGKRGKARRVTLHAKQSDAAPADGGGGGGVDAGLAPRAQLGRAIAQRREALESRAAAIERGELHVVDPREAREARLEAARRSSASDGGLGTRSHVVVAADGQSTALLAAIRSRRAAVERQMALAEREGLVPPSPRAAREARMAAERSQQFHAKRGGRAAAAGAPARARRPGFRGRAASAGGAVVGGLTYAPSSRSGSLSTLRRRSSGSSRCAGAAATAMWRRVEAPGGRAYFWNAATDQVQWHAPPAEEMDGAEAAPAAPRVERPHAPPGDDEEWQEMTDSATGDSYYWNVRTGETAWEAPDATPNVSEVDGLHDPD